MECLEAYGVGDGELHFTGAGETMWDIFPPYFAAKPTFASSRSFREMPSFRQICQCVRPRLHKLRQQRMHGNRSSGGLAFRQAHGATGPCPPHIDDCVGKTHILPYAPLATAHAILAVGDWVFPSFKLKGRQPRVANMLVKTHLRQAAAKAGILSSHSNEKGGLLEDDPRRFGFHNLRHSLASFLIRSKTDPKTVQALLRHSDAPKGCFSSTRTAQAKIV